MINLSKYIIGNDELINSMLISFQEKNLSNSIIFHGPKGIGKATLVLNLISKIFKQFLNNDKYENHYKLIYNNSHPNIRYIQRSFEEKNKKINKFITIDQIRNLNNFINQSSFNNLPKFIVIDSANHLNINSSNALLKILEEPKKNTYFFLIAHQISSILHTIRSRCIKFKLEIPNKDQFNKILESCNQEIKHQDIDFLYHISNASPGLALDINSEKISFLFESIYNVLQINDNKENAEIFKLADFVNNLSNDEFRIFLMILRFILLSSIKINLGIKTDPISFNQVNYNMSKINLDNLNILNILDYLSMNEGDLFNYNLDKKIFCLNIFIPLKKI